MKTYTFPKEITKQSLRMEMLSRDKFLWAAHHIFLGCQTKNISFCKPEQTSLWVTCLINFFPCIFRRWCLQSRALLSITLPQREVTIAEVVAVLMLLVFFLLILQLFIIFLHTITCCINFQWFELSAGSEFFFTSSHSALFQYSEKQNRRLNAPCKRKPLHGTLAEFSLSRNV